VNDQERPARWRPTFGRHWESVIVVILFVFGAVLAFGYLNWLDGQGGIGGDFRSTTWGPGEAVLNGRSPYPEPDLVTLHFLTAPYPAPYLVVLAPISLLPFDLATGVWMTALAASILVALWAVGLRDTRCYAIALVSLPVMASIGLGNATALLMLSTALLWRWRDRPHHGAVAFSCGLLVKPILWPLFIWLLATRRTRLSVEAAVIASLAALAGWAAIGFDGLAEYPALLRAASNAMASNNLLVTNVLLDSGLSLRIAALSSLLLGACLLIGSIWVRSDLDRFALGIAAARKSADLHRIRHR